MILNSSGIVQLLCLTVQLLNSAGTQVLRNRTLEVPNINDAKQLSYRKVHSRVNKRVHRKVQTEFRFRIVQVQNSSVPELHPCLQV